MIIVNKPTHDLIDVQCYICKAIFQVSPMHNSNSPFIVDCELHKPKCKHECDGQAYYSSPPQSKCTKCGEFYK